jgi:FKBP12-rapamycin complex-associated protein
LHVKDIMPILIDALKDQGSSLKREEALKVLYNLGSYVGYVMEPYLNYPELLNLLIHCIRSESISSVRFEATMVLGTLGALDPFMQRTLSSKVYEEQQQQELLLSKRDWMSKSMYSSLSDILSTLNPSQEDYYPLLVIHSLMKILKDPSLNIHHIAVVQAFMYMFKTLGLRCTHYLSHIMPVFINMLRSAPSNLMEFHFQQLAVLLNIIRQHVRPYSEEIVNLVLSCWNDIPSCHSTLINVIEALSMAMEIEFRKHLPTILPILADACEKDSSDQRMITGRVLHAFAIMASRLNDFVYIILPSILHACERTSLPLKLRLHALHVLAYLASTIDLSNYVSPIIHMFVRLLPIMDSDLRSAAMQSLTAIAYYTSDDFQMFIPLLNRVSEFEICDDRSIN